MTRRAGNYAVKSAADLSDALNALKGRELYAEKWANFKMELAVMVVKTEDGTSTDGLSTVAYPAVETIHEDSICKLVYLPPRGLPQKKQREAQELASRAVGSLWGKGVFGVEMFLMDTGNSSTNSAFTTTDSSCRSTCCQRNCSTPAQFGSLHHRSMPNIFTIQIATPLDSWIHAKIPKFCHTSYVSRNHHVEHSRGCLKGLPQSAYEARHCYPQCSITHVRKGIKACEEDWAHHCGCQFNV